MLFKRMSFTKCIQRFHMGLSAHGSILYDASNILALSTRALQPGRAQGIYPWRARKLNFEMSVARIVSQYTFTEWLLPVRHQSSQFG